MKLFNNTFRNLSIGNKITFLSIGLTGTFVVVLIMVVSYMTSSLLEARANREVAGELADVTNIVEVFNSAVTNEAMSFARIFADSFNAPFSVDTQIRQQVAGKLVPTLKSGETVLGMDFTAPDHFTAMTGATATIFVADGEDFVRISTSVKNERGERAIGTKLDRSHPGYALLRSGQKYVGLASLFGKQYITHYDPIKDAHGSVIGVLYVGVDLSKDLQVLKQKINSIKIGDSGYFYVINAAPGKNFGNLLIHPNKEGRNILDNKEPEYSKIASEMLTTKSGIIRGRWADADESDTSVRDRVINYANFKEWNWVIVGVTYTDEIIGEATIDPAQIRLEK